MSTPIPPSGDPDAKAAEAGTTRPAMRTLHAAALSPFRDDETLDLDVLAQLIRHGEGQGIGGVYAGGGSAEVMMLTDAERIETFRVVCQAAAPETHLIAQVGAVSLTAAQRMAEAAAALGFHALSSTLPHYYGFSADELHTYVSELTRATDLPMVVYYAPSTANVRLEPARLAGLLDIDNVAGVKYTDHNLFHLNGLRRSHPRAVLFNGYDEILLAGLVMGADAGIGTTYCVQGRRIRRVHELAAAGDLDAARIEQAKVCDLVRIMIPYGVLASTKYLLSLQGIDVGVCRRPFATLGGTARGELRAYHASEAGQELLELA